MNYIGIPRSRALYSYLFMVTNYSCVCVDVGRNVTLKRNSASMLMSLNRNCIYLFNGNANIVLISFKNLMGLQKQEIWFHEREWKIYSKNYNLM